MPIMKIPW
ncbi:Protein of unknown function [Thermobacillus xylanilyticus]|uniref:Uncharacterized protein n=1 Tax=Thermobacillus xylanilyticus TaxID=76633 RepID=A0ABN7S750_THEXY|nr:Protein of unknown function [Thermobacillus xylanilyticus]